MRGVDLQIRHFAGGTSPSPFSAFESRRKLSQFSGVGYRSREGGLVDRGARGVSYLPAAAASATPIRRMPDRADEHGAGSIRCPASITAGSITHPTILMTGQSWVSAGGGPWGLDVHRVNAVGRCRDRKGWRRAGSERPTRDGQSGYRVERAHIDRARFCDYSAQARN